VFLAIKLPEAIAETLISERILYGQYSFVELAYLNYHISV
jgi:hypothetical protein